jgi:tetrahydromethanopterin S-methyltransferase subunit B
MKKLMILGLVYIVGGITGVIFSSATSGAADRSRIAVLENELKSRNDKLDKCTDALINSLHPNAPQTAAPPTATSPN